ncbi:MAG: sulfatase-like hydrolase/transferase, partial [Burkholderiales bacterium]
MRIRLRIVRPILLLAAAWAAGACGPRTTTPHARSGRAPDVVLITIDTLRADRLGCYGYAAARTPTLDGLAKRGARFEVAVAQAPLTAPSHASVLTGLTPLAHGVRDNGAYVLPRAV